MRKSRFTTAMALMSMALLWIIMPSCLRDKDAGGKVRHDLQLNELRAVSLWHQRREPGGGEP